MPSLISLTSYPTKESYGGIFVREQLQLISSISNYRVYCIAHIPYVPFPLRYLYKYKHYIEFPVQFIDRNIDVYKSPNFVSLPGTIAWKYVNGLSLYRSCRNIVKYILRNTNRKEVVLHSNWIVPRGMAGVLLSKEFDIPHVLTLRSGSLVEEIKKSKPFYLLVKNILKSTDHVIAVSQPLADVANTFCRYNKISIIPNGVSIESINNLSLQEENVLNSMRKKHDIESIKVLFMGSDLKNKGFYYLWDAWKQLRLSGINLHLLAVGLNQSDIVALTNDAVKSNLSDYCTLEGTMPWNAARLRYHIANIFILPSFSEGFPNSLIEAVACNIPIVSTPVGGVSEFLINRTNGLLIEQRSVESICDAIKYIINNPEHVKHMADLASLSLHDKYDMKRNAERIINIYDNLLQT